MASGTSATVRATLALCIFSPIVAAQEVATSDDWSDMVRVAPLAGTLGLYSSQSEEETVPWTETRPDSLPPASLPYTRTLPEGSWLFGYRYSIQSFDGLRDSRDDKSSAELFAAGYTVAPTEQTSMTHTFEVLRGFDGWTLFATVPFHDRDQDVDFMGGGGGSIDASGLGDLIIGGIVPVFERDHHKVLAHLGLAIPTGSFDEKDGGVVVPYALQPGSGTFDWHPGVTYMSQYGDWSWGSDVRLRIHMGKNSDDWARANEGWFSVWGARQFDDAFSGSLRLNGYSWGDYHGETDDLDPAVSPANDPHRQGGDRIDLSAGLNWQFGEREVKEQRLAVEFGVPVDEWLDGPGLSTDWLGTLSWQISF